MVRKRAALMGWVLHQNGDQFTVSDDGRNPLFTGTLDATELWVRDGFVPNAPGPAPEPTPPAWAPWLDLFATEQRAARRTTGTIASRVSHLTTFARRRPDLTPLTVTRADLVEYLGDQPDWSPRTAHSVRTTFRVFFRLLVDLEHRTIDPARTLPSVSIPRSLPRPCPDHVVQQAYSSSDVRLGLALRIFVEAGLRRSEVARVASSDVLGRPGEYRLHVVGKGGHERSVPISDELATRILAAGDGHAFPGTDGKPISAEHLGKLVANALPGRWTAHTLRHRFATVAYQHSSDLRAVQELLGHASPTTTAVYTKVTDSAMRRAAEAARLDPD